MYTAPDSLRGVPIERIKETGAYWERTWDSLDAFIAHEDEERSLKEQYQARRDAEPNNVTIQKRAKFHQDNMSKHFKIREIFGDHSPYHPNQLVAKRHLPVEGLCQKELMYRVACKISDLKILNEKGSLAMDAWDFIRWRIGLKIAERINHLGENGKRFVRTIIYKLCDEDKQATSGGYEDSIMRQAVLISARYQNRISSFKTKGTAEPGGSQPPFTGKHRVRRSRHRSNNTQHETTVATRQEERQERRARLAAQTGSYQGVNAFRAMQKNKRE